MQLTSFAKKPYSLLETHIFGALPQDGTRIKSRELAEARQNMGPWDVDNPLNTITVTMNNLIRKVRENDEDFFIKKSGRRPGHPEVEYWMLPR